MVSPFPLALVLALAVSFSFASFVRFQVLTKKRGKNLDLSPVTKCRHIKWKIFYICNKNNVIFRKLISVKFMLKLLSTTFLFIITTMFNQFCFFHNEFLSTMLFYSVFYICLREKKLDIHDFSIRRPIRSIHEIATNEFYFLKHLTSELK